MVLVYKYIHIHLHLVDCLWIGKYTYNRPMDLSLGEVKCIPFFDSWEDDVHLRWDI